MCGGPWDRTHWFMRFLSLWICVSWTCPPISRHSWTSSWFGNYPSLEISNNVLSNQFITQWIGCIASWLLELYQRKPHPVSWSQSSIWKVQNCNQLLCWNSCLWFDAHHVLHFISLNSSCIFAWIAYDCEYNERMHHVCLGSSTLKFSKDISFYSKVLHPSQFVGSLDEAY